MRTRPEAPPGERWCSGHQANHPVSAFRKKAAAADGLRSACREYEDERNATWVKNNRQAKVASSVAWQKRNPEKVRVIQLRVAAKRLGLDPDDIERRWLAHNKLCDCCGEPERGERRLAIEHNHATGEFRGFTCINCNLMLGHAKDDPDRLLAGVAYLRARN